MKYAILLLFVLVTETWGDDLEFGLGEPALVPGSNSDKQEKSNAPDSAIFIKEVIDYHNRVRRLHQAGPLTEDPVLTSMAQAWAEHLLKIRDFKHNRDRGDAGENLAYVSELSTRPNGEMFAAQWYNEKEFYNDIYGRDPTLDELMQVGHFTQVVWKATTKIGVGMATDGHRIYVVANYLPSGNYFGMFGTNVLKPLK